MFPGGAASVVYSGVWYNSLKRMTFLVMYDTQVRPLTRVYIARHGVVDCRLAKRSFCSVLSRSVRLALSFVEKKNRRRLVYSISVEERSCSMDVLELPTL